MSELVTISSSVLPRGVQVLGFRGTETISRPYEIEIFLFLRQELGEELDLADAIGGKARLVVDRHELGVPPFVFAGVFGKVEVLHASDGHVVVRAVLVPRLWQLALGRHSRIFTKMKVPDIIKAVLEENGVTDYEFRLGTYEVEEHVCQYRESDLDFISRWMEREGIFYFFEHGDDGERLVLTDHRAYDDDELGLPVRYYPQFGSDGAKGMRFRSFTCRHTTLPASVRLKDYDYAKPNLNVSGTAKVADNGTGEVNLYGERFFSPSAGDRLARIRAEEMLARQAVYHAAGNRTHLRAGYTFEVDEHPFPSFNTKYLAYAVHHTANQANGHPAVRAMLQMEGGDDVYGVEVDAVPAKLQFRAESVTAWPRIYGYENGIVDGPADSEYAQIDEQGRYNAKFKFDESTLKGGKATTWVRMMQPHGGDIEGFHFPLRKGTEVVFSYLGGDPDRPVISGVVPNAINPSPVTSANHTRNVIQTGARNRFELEDKAGTEWIRLSTPYATSFLNMGLAYPSHEVTLSTQQNIGFGAMAALDIGVGEGIPGPSGAGNMTVHVLNNLTTIVDDADMKTTVSSGNAFHTVSSGTFTELVQSKVTETYNTGHESTVNGALRKATFNVGQQTTVNGGLTEETYNVGHKTTVHAGQELTVTGGQHTKITGGQTIDVTGDQTVTVATNKEETIASEYKLTVGGAEVRTTSGPYSEIKGDTHFEMTGGAKAEIYGGANFEGKLAVDMSVTVGVMIEITAALKLALELGAGIELNLAESFVFAPLEVEIKQANLKDAILDIATTPTHTRMGALVSNLAGLFAVV